jgi:hypothetical protein
MAYRRDDALIFTEGQDPLDAGLDPSQPIGGSLESNRKARWLRS